MSNPNQPLEPFDNPLAKSRDDFEQLIAKISVVNSPVGIDAQYTHAIIIDFLRQINRRLERIEERLNDVS